MYKRLVTTLYKDGKVAHAYYVGELLMNKIELKQRPFEAVKYGCQMANTYEVEEHIIKSRIGRIPSDHTYLCPNFK